MTVRHLFVFLFLVCDIQVSSSSSCAKLQKIVYNLPGGCGAVKLECNGNDPIFHLETMKFLVKDISFENTTFRLVDPSFSASGDHCSLPNQTFPRDDAFGTFLDSIFFADFYFADFYFVNCKNEIEDSKYVLFSCQNRTNSSVYAVTNGIYYASDIPDSCSLIGEAFSASDPLEFGNWTAGSIMQAIEYGVLVNWTAGSNICSEGWLDVPCSILGRCFCGCFSQHNGDFEYLMGSFFRRFIFWQPHILWCLYHRVSRFAFSFTLLLFILLDIVLAILAARIILFPLAICSFLVQKHRRVSSSVSSIENFLRKNEILRIRRYDFVEISIMTNHFTEKLGQGGFGSVYRGKLLSGQQVAVKILSNSVGDGDDFISEVASIGRIHHTNIVRLVGFCSEGSQRALIYPCMPNGSLDKYIFSSSTCALSVEKRREIAIGIARGIDYLHRGCEMQILHFDIKPHNILLDYDLTPKVSDFGLARLYCRDYNLVTLSMARGTIGYIAPELISRTFGAISYKVDVYSFGMLLMEMASGRRNVNNHAESSNQVYYPSWVYDQLNLPEEPQNLSNSNIVKFGAIEELLYKVALWCIQMKASNRPTMSRVIEMLHSDADGLEMPPRPFMECSTSQDFPVSSSEIETRGTELSVISEEISML